MRFEIYFSMLVIGIFSSMTFSAPVPDDGQSTTITTSTTSSSPFVAPTQTPTPNSNNINGPVNNGQNSNQDNQIGNDGMITIPIQIDTSILRALLDGDQSGQSDPLEGLPVQQKALENQNQNSIDNSHGDHTVNTTTSDASSTATSSTSASSTSTPSSTQIPSS